MKTNDEWTEFYQSKSNFAALHNDYQELKARDRTKAEDEQFCSICGVISKHMET